MSPIIINPFEGLANIYNWAAHVKASGIAGGGDDFATARVHTTLSPVSGTVTQAGGDLYHSIIIKIADDPLGRSVRICENAIVLVHVGQVVSIFEPIAQNDLYRSGQYKGSHVNGIDSKGHRIPFLPMVTHTQVAAHAALAPAVLGPKQRKVVATTFVNRRTGPGTNFPTTGEQLAPNTVGNFVGWAYGQDNEPKRIWLKGISGSWFVAEDFTDQGTHDLADLNTAPADAPVVVPPVTVDTPVDVPPVVTPPVDTPPVDVPPVTTPPVDVPPVVTPPVVTTPAPPSTTPTKPTVPVLTPPAKSGSKKGGVIAGIIAGIALIGGVIAAAWPW